MLLGRRHPLLWPDRLRLALWPRRSFARSARYVALRIVRLGGAPHALALGVAAGVFAATLPIPGLQMLLAAVLAWMLQARISAALLATFWANPLTLPVIWLVAHGIGQLLLGATLTGSVDVVGIMAAAKSELLLHGANPTRAYVVLSPLLLPLAVGGLVLGLASAAAAYALTLRLITRHRADRTVDRSLVRVLPVAGWSRRPL